MAYSKQEIRRAPDEKLDVELNAGEEAQRLRARMAAYRLVGDAVGSMATGCGWKGERRGRLPRNAHPLFVVETLQELQEGRAMWSALASYLPVHGG